MMDRHDSPPKPSTVEPINGVSHPLPSSPTNPPQPQSVSLRESPLSTVYNDQNNIRQSAIYLDHVGTRIYEEPQTPQGGSSVPSSVPGEVSLLPLARNSQSLEQIHLGSDDITQLFHK